MEFHYECKDINDNVSRGIMQAQTIDEVAASLKQAGMQILSIEQKRASALDVDIASLVNYISNQDVLTFTIQLSTMISAGLTIVVALEAIAEQMETPAMKKVIYKLKSDIESGMNFSDALSNQEKTFGSLYIGMVQVGEQTGSLEVVLTQLAEFSEKSADLRSKVRTALTYPFVVSCIACVVVAFLITFVIPNFLNIFANSNVELPAPTVLLIDITDFLRNDYMTLIGIVFLCAVTFWQIINIPAGKRVWDRFKISIPVIGKVVRKVNVSHFALTFGALTKAGVPLTTALLTLKNSLSNTVYKNVVDSIITSVESGGTISEGMTKHKEVPPMIVRMIDAGEKTGNIELMLDKINLYYDREVESSIKIMTSLIEPALILFLAIVVGFIMLAVMLPLLNMTKVFKN